MARKAVSISVVIPDASPLLSLGRVRRLDIFGAFVVPVHIPDVVAEEAQRTQNDANGAVREWLASRPNNVQTIETTFGLGLRQRRARGEDPPTGGLGELAVEEYALTLARQGNPSIVPLILFEDPDVLDLKIARHANAHLINTAALLTNFDLLAVVPDGRDVLHDINALRATPMIPFERTARTKRVASTVRGALKGV